jgi:cyanophycinase-like exopeptidase
MAISKRIQSVSIAILALATTVAGASVGACDDGPAAPGPDASADGTSMTDATADRATNVAQDGATDAPPSTDAAAEGASTDAGWMGDAFAPIVNLTAHLTGSALDVSPVLHGPLLHFSGGDANVRQSFRDGIDAIRGCTGTACPTTLDVVVLQVEGRDEFNTYLQGSAGVDSVETFVIQGRDAASDPRVVAQVDKAEYVFINGVNQCPMHQFLAETPLIEAMKRVYARKGAIGGMSAGFHLFGGKVYEPCPGVVTSATALANPYSTRVSFRPRMFDIADLDRTFTESNVEKYDRMGRLFTFLAREIKDKNVKPLWGFAMDNGSSVLIDTTGQGKVLGLGGVWLVEADGDPEVCAANQPLSATGFRMWKYVEGDTINLRSRPTAPEYTVDVDAGVLSRTPY